MEYFFYILISLIIIFFLVVTIISTTKIYITNYSVINGSFTKEITNKEGLKIVVFSDIHIGRLLKRKQLEKMLNKITNINADLYIFLGDLNGQKVNKYYSLEDIKEAFKVFEGKKIVAIRGNHEFKKDGQDLKNKLDNFNSAGFINLVNESYEITKNDKTYKIYGLDDTMYQKQVLPETLYDLVLVHEPDTALKLDNNQLVLAGHTHGGQIDIPLFYHYKPVYGKKFKYGIANNNKLIVTSGLGFSGFKIRFKAKREIVVINYIK